MTIKPRPHPASTSRALRNARLWQRLLEWAVTLYTMSTVIEGALFSVGSARISRFVALFLIAIVLIYVVSNRMPRFLNLPLIGLIGVFTLVALTALSSEYAEVISLKLGTFGMMVAACTALAAALAILGEQGIVCIQRGLVASAAAASLLIITARVQGNFVGAEQFGRLGERATAGLADPNDIALALTVALPACFGLRHQAARYFLPPIIVAGILFTGSRGGLIALGAGGLAAFLLLARANAHALLQAGRAVVLAGVALAAAWTFLPEKLVERFSSVPEEVTTGTMTRRTLYWKAAWEQFSENPFWGAGPGSSIYLNYVRTGRSQVFHNTYLSFLVELGIFGWLFFAIAFLAAWIGAVRTSRTFGWPAVSMAAMTVGIFGLPWETKKLLWLLLIMGGALLAMTAKKPPIKPSQPHGDALRTASGAHNSKKNRLLPAKKKEEQARPELAGRMRSTQVGPTTHST